MEKDEKKVEDRREAEVMVSGVVSRVSLVGTVFLEEVGTDRLFSLTFDRFLAINVRHASPVVGQAVRFSVDGDFVTSIQ